MNTIKSIAEILASIANAVMWVSILILVFNLSKCSNPVEISVKTTQKPEEQAE